jgi:hypothetical protein
VERARLLANRALVLLRLRRFADAESDCRAAAAADPTAVKPRIRLATALQHQGRFAEAAAVLRSDALPVAVSLGPSGKAFVATIEQTLAQLDVACADGIAIADALARVEQASALRGQTDTESRECAELAAATRCLLTAPSSSWAASALALRRLASRHPVVFVAVDGVQLLDECQAFDDLLESSDCEHASTWAVAGAVICATALAVEASAVAARAVAKRAQSLRTLRDVLNLSVRVLESAKAPALEVRQACECCCDALRVCLPLTDEATLTALGFWEMVENAWLRALPTTAVAPMPMAQLWDALAAVAQSPVCSMSMRSRWTAATLVEPTRSFLLASAASSTNDAGRDGACASVLASIVRSPALWEAFLAKSESELVRGTVLWATSDRCNSALRQNATVFLAEWWTRSKMAAAPSFAGVADQLLSHFAAAVIETRHVIPDEHLEALATCIVRASKVQHFSEACCASAMQGIAQQLAEQQHSAVARVVIRVLSALTSRGASVPDVLRSVSVVRWLLDGWMLSDGEKSTARANVALLVRQILRAAPALADACSRTGDAPRLLSLARSLTSAAERENVAVVIGEFAQHSESFRVEFRACDGAQVLAQMRAEGSGS